MHQALSVACEACNKCQARTEQSINNFLKINKTLEEQLQASLEAKAEPTNLEAITRLLDLIEPDIEWQEKYRPDSAKMAPIIAVFRELRPK